MRPYLFFKENPFVRLLVFFILGISLVRYYELYRKYLVIPAILLLLASFVWLIFQGKNSRTKNIRGILIFSLMVSCGGIMYDLHTRHYSISGKTELYTGYVQGKPVLKGSYYQCDCLLRGCIRGDSLHHLRQKVRLYLEYDSLSPLPCHKDKISFRGSLQVIKNRGNPGEFNYAGYMADEGIQHSVFLRKEDYLLLSNEGSWSLKRLAAGMQEKLISKFSDSGIEDQELGVISALIAGDRQYLDQEIKSAYIRAGAMHVLAVSGLHVGILYLFLGLLFGSRINFFWYRMLRLLFILSALWSYAFITGLSTSVLRAAIMFSFFLLGKSFNRSASSYNLLAASALLILVLDPNELYKVGFQYSFLAVLGILYFQPRIEKILNMRYALPDRIWQLTSVSIAAQLTTFPLALYYFHQFPSYFLLSNLLIIPLIWLIMVATLLFFIIPPVGALPDLTAELLSFLLRTNNEVVGFISELPGSTILHIRFEAYHLVFTILFILLAIYLLERNRKRWILHLSMVYTILLLALGINSFPKTTDKTLILIYSIKGGHIISFFQGNQHLILTKSSNKKQIQQSISYMEPYWVSRQSYRNMEHLHIDDHWRKDIRVVGRVDRRREAEDGGLHILIDSPSYSIFYGNTRLLYPAKGQDIDSMSLKKDIWLIDRACGYPGRVSGAPDMIVLMVDLGGRLKEAWDDYAEMAGIEVWDLREMGACCLGF